MPPQFLSHIDDERVPRGGETAGRLLQPSPMGLPPIDLGVESMTGATLRVVKEGVDTAEVFE